MYLLKILLLLSESLKIKKQKANPKLPEKSNFTYLRKLQKTLCLYLFHKEGKWKDRFTENTEVMWKKSKQTG